MKRGELWWANLPKPTGKRPVVLLSRDEAYAVRNAVTVAPVTTTIRDMPVEVPLGKGEGLPKAYVANLDTIMTIRKDRLKQRIALLSPKKMGAIEKALKFALALK